MISKLKALGLAVAAALVLIAVTASSASASLEFTSASAGTTTLHGNQSSSHVWTASVSEGFGGISCTTATLSGTVTGSTHTAWSLKPTYSGCKDTFGRTVHIITNSLEYIFTVIGTSGGTPVGQVHVKGHIETTITTPIDHCKITISTEQTNGGITYHNHTGGTDDILVTTKATGIISTTSGGLFNCGIQDGVHADGEYTGNTIIGGTSSPGGTSVAITADGT